MKTELKVLRELVCDAAARCDDVCNDVSIQDRLCLLDDIVLLLSSALADAKCLRDAIAEELE